MRTALFHIFLAVFLASTSSAQTYTTLGLGSCGGDKANCHAAEFKTQIDKHKNALDDMSSADAIKYAQLSYNISKENIVKGNSICMTCHGTVVTGKETAEVEDGVSCEACHGPGSGYRDSHKDVPKDKGGYDIAVKAGLTDLRKLDVRSKACVRCHLTTDQKILSAGHPSGLQFKYANQMKPLSKHWKRSLTDADRDQAPFDVAIAARGPLPVVKTVAAPKPAEEGGTPVTSSATAPRPQPVLATSIPANTITTPVSVGPISLDPFPQLSDTASVDSILIVVKKRLEMLYLKTNPAGKR